MEIAVYAESTQQQQDKYGGEGEKPRDFAQTLQDTDLGAGKSQFFDSKIIDQRVPHRKRESTCSSEKYEQIFGIFESIRHGGPCTRVSHYSKGCSIRVHGFAQAAE